MDHAVLQRLFDSHRSITDGDVATYIPELAKANPAHFAVAIASIDGTVHALGDAQQQFTLQSISKPFAYGLALEDHGYDRVHATVGFEPTGEAFDSIIELEKESHRPYNPMINSGAIAIASLVQGRDAAERLQRVRGMFARYVGHPLHVDTGVYLSGVLVERPELCAHPCRVGASP